MRLLELPLGHLGCLQVSCSVHKQTWRWIEAALIYFALA